MPMPLPPSMTLSPEPTPTPVPTSPVGPVTVERPVSPVETPLKRPVASVDHPPPRPPVKIPVIETVSGRLNEDETSFILRTTLLPEHREDANVLRFIAAYVRCRDTRQAAREAGLDSRSGLNLRNRPDIYSCITKITEKSVSKFGFDASDVVERVKEISSLDPIDFLKSDGSYKKMHEMPPEARRAIKKMTVKNLYGEDPNGMRTIVGEIINIEIESRLRAHELLGREKEVFVEKKKVEHDIGGNIKDILLENKSRADAAFNQLVGREVLEIQSIEDKDEVIIK